MKIFSLCLCDWVRLPVLPSPSAIHIPTPLPHVPANNNKITFGSCIAMFFSVLRRRCDVFQLLVRCRLRDWDFVCIVFTSLHFGHWFEQSVWCTRVWRPNNKTTILRFHSLLHYNNSYVYFHSIAIAAPLFRSIHGRPKRKLVIVRFRSFSLTQSEMAGQSGAPRMPSAMRCMRKNAMCHKVLRDSFLFFTFFAGRFGKYPKIEMYVLDIGEYWNMRQPECMPTERTD